MTSLYLGIDIGKSSHSAALVSAALLTKHRKRESCPSFSFDQTRAGFEKLLTAIKVHALPTETCVLVERTGHYGKALEQYLQEQGVTVYRVHVQAKPKGSKSDKRDAQALAVLLYNQLELGILVSDTAQIAHLLVPPSASAQLLCGLVQHRQELVREHTQRKNKLTAIGEELFPEFAQICMNPNTPSALALREKYPTPADVAAATIDDLAATRKHFKPGRADLARLQELAKTTIGTKNPSRLTALALEQKQLIKELQLLDTHIEELDVEVAKAVAASREGQILTSIPAIGPMQAAMLIAAIGSIANFESEAKLRAFAGWSPRQTQTGTSYDSVVLDRRGNRLLKSTLFLIGLRAVKEDTQWKVLYDRLVPLKCIWDERVGRYRGRMKVIGRIIGQMLGVAYTLLKRDYDVQASTAPGKEPAAPELYDVTKHRMNKKGHPVPQQMEEKAPALV